MRVISGWDFSIDISLPCAVSAQMIANGELGCMWEISNLISFYCSDKL